jgi:dimethylhistidine N-methyltransferase
MTVANKKIMAEVIEGLQEPQRRLSSKYFYDKRGSELFEQICRLEEYYLTRCEMSIMTDNIEEISSVMGENCVLVELGSGSTKKIRVLLDSLKNPVAHVPVDISSKFLMLEADELRRDYPNLIVYPVATDYTKDFTVPEITEDPHHTVIYYPGSSIGNFTPEFSRRLLSRLAGASGKGSGLLIGVDLKKQRDVLEAAYNDKKGVTAEFNLNMLRHLNSLLGCRFDLSGFEHYAFYNEREGRIEMYLNSTKDQEVQVNNTCLNFTKGEGILTEYSYKYSIGEFHDLVSGIYRPEACWTDPEDNFSVQYLSVV